MDPRRPDHDVRLCKLVQAWLATQLRVPVGECGSPEREASERRLSAQPKAVEYRATLGGREYFFEHTILQLYDRQKHDDIIFERSLYGLRTELRKCINGHGRYYLLFDTIDLRRRPTNIELAAVFGELECWLTALGAPPLPENGAVAPRVRRLLASTVLEALGLPVQLQWMPFSRTDLVLGRLVPTDFLDRYLRSASTAFEKKLPKLRDARGDAGCSVLVLEAQGRDLDSALVAAAVAKAAIALQSRELRPDLIVVVETDTVPEVLHVVDSPAYPNLVDVAEELESGD